MIGIFRIVFLAFIAVLPSIGNAQSSNAQYGVCLYCGKHKFDLMEIVVPSGLGGIFTV